MGMDIIEKVRQISSSYIGGRGIEIVDMTYRREQKGMVLRILVDKPEGITIAECEEINNFLSAGLDKEDVIQDRYTLEVSSPGLDRPIKTDRDFERAMGRVIEINTYEKVDEKKYLHGKLLGMDSDKIVIESDGVSTAVPKAKIALARLKIEF